jgi:hypothetical protein
MGLSADPSGSEKMAGKPAFCAIPAAGESREKNVSTR